SAQTQNRVCVAIVARINLLWPPYFFRVKARKTTNCSGLSRSERSSRLHVLGHQGRIPMKRTTVMFLMSFAVGLVAPTLPSFSAGDLVANPETIFAKGMGFSERNGENKGV